MVHLSIQDTLLWPLSENNKQRRGLGRTRRSETVEMEVAIATVRRHEHSLPRVEGGNLSVSSDEDSLSDETVDETGSEDSVPPAKRACPESPNSLDTPMEHAQPTALADNSVTEVVTVPVCRDVLERRRKSLASVLELAFEDIQLVRGQGLYVYDKNGERYMDCLNNVAHVGHAHPRVTEAVAKQMDTIACNTLYLHENIVKYAEHLKTKMPGDLSSFHFTNSGSEANDLSLRIAKEVTGGSVVIALRNSYHGHLGSLLAISTMKNYTTSQEDVLIAPCPDVYRGEHRDPETAGHLYALEVKRMIEEAQSKGKKIAAFISEIVVCCGGLIFMPKGYLTEVYQYVREAGGLCIADEVQVGFGRAGKHFWMFEEHGVVPDILTFGKPMGNGFPVSGVVITPSVNDLHQKKAPPHFNSFGGNAVSMAAAEAVLCVMEDEKLQENASEVGEYLMKEAKELMAKYPQHLGDVRGRGLLFGFELVKDPHKREPYRKMAKYMVEKLRTEFHIVLATDYTNYNVLRIKPPMVFTKEDVDYLMSSLGSLIGKFSEAQHQTGH